MGFHSIDLRLQYLTPYGVADLPFPVLHPFRSKDELGPFG